MSLFRGRKEEEAPASAVETSASDGESPERRRGRRKQKGSFAQGVAVALLAVAAALLIFWLAAIRRSPGRPDSLGALAKITWLENTIRSEYMGEIDERAQVDGMLYGLVASLGDPYSTYYTAEEYEEISSGHKGQTEGIGIVLMQDAETGDLLITEVLEDSPAAAAGLLAGDVIIEINGENAEGMGSAEAAEKIGAIAGEPVVLRIRRGEEELEFSMEKAAIEVRSVAGTMLEDDIGYIQISTFNDLTPLQFATVYTECNRAGMRGLIIDLRENRGGLVDACCNTLEQFLSPGVIVYEEDKKGNQETRECAGETPIEIPLVLLVNRNTASSSEIFAGAVQDHGDGVVVGETTLGKGIEQNYYQLPDGSVVKLTTTHYFTPNHRDLHLAGLVPDVDLSDVEFSETEDAWLNRAIEELKKQL